jgi:AcrR family transcriptional regulator
MFRDKEHCFQAAYEMNAGLVAQIMEMGLEQLEELDDDRRASPLEKLERVLGLYIGTLANAPALARVFLVEVYAAGPEAIAQRRASIDRFVDIVAATHVGQTGRLGTSENQRFAAEMIVNAVSAAVTNIVGTGEMDQLGELQRKLTDLARELFGAADGPTPGAQRSSSSRSATLRATDGRAPVTDADT